MNFADAANINQLWAMLLIEELVRNGVRHFCLAPGSRNAPLSLAAASNDRVKLITHFDERGLAFHALGFAQATGEPAVAMCTSGSAAANFWPAVVEASQARLPLILLTADRPPELLGCGANQAIDQCKLYGDYVRASYHLPCPTRDIEPTYVLTTVDEAVYRAIRAPAGPVHINCQFREPLAPIGQKYGEEDYLMPLESWEKSKHPWTSWYAPAEAGAEGTCRDLEDSLSVEVGLGSSALKRSPTRRTLLIVGRLLRRSEMNEASRFAMELMWPTYPDILSGLRTDTAGVHWIHHFDELAADPYWNRTCAPETVLHIGGPITSKSLLKYLSELRPEYIHVDDHPLRQDPDHLVTKRIQGGLSHFLGAFGAEFARKYCPHPEIAVGLLADVNRRIDAAIQEALDKELALTEIHVARLVSQLRPEDAPLFLANSMPIRDMDRFADPAGPSGPVYANRGASGIDGNLATAAAHARGRLKPLTVVIGDQAMLHDLNSLALYRNLKVPAVIIVINNDGGGIFSFLPIAEFPVHFETCFGAPHGLHFAEAARLFGFRYALPATPSAFSRDYQEALLTPTTTIIEVRTDRAENLQVHNKISRAIRKRLGERAS